MPDQRGLKIGIAALALETAGDFRRAGVARYSASLIDAIVAGPYSKHQFHLFVLPTLEVPAAWSEAPNVTIHRTWPRYTRWNMLAAGPLAQKLKLDFYFSTVAPIPLFTLVKRGVFVHDLFVVDHPEWFPDGRALAAARLLPSAIRQSTLVFANSEHTKGGIFKQFPEAKEKVVVTPLGPGNDIQPVDRDQVKTEDLARLGIPFQHYLVCLSTLEPRKNLARLFEAFAQLVSQKEFEEVGLVVAGGKGWKYEEALAKLDELGIQERVAQIGYVDDKDLPALLARAELFICPSLSEGFGMPVLEAMMAGVPVISSEAGALPEVGGKAVRYFDPYDVQDMAEAIGDALHNESERSFWIENGFARANEFSWERTAKETIEAIEQACAGSLA